MDLVEYMTNLRFLSMSRPNSYEITGELEHVSRLPFIQTQEQKDFTLEYRKLISVLIYYEKFRQLIEPDTEPLRFENLSVQRLKEILNALGSLNIESYFEPQFILKWSEIYHHIMQAESGSEEV